MSVVVSLQEVGPCRKQLTVEVPVEAVEAETRAVLKEYGRHARVPGFRKGKVPVDLLRRRFGKDIEREVVERLLPRYWKKAEEESEIDPLLPPEVDEVKDLSPGSPLTFVATVETRPQVALGDLEGFNLPDPPIEPGVVDVDEALEDIRLRLSTWGTVERAAGRGDLVAAEIAETPQTAETPQVPELKAGEQGEEPPEAGEASPQALQTSQAPRSPQTPQKIEVELGDPRVWEELSLALTGLAAGQEATFTHHDEPAAGAAGQPPAAPRERRFRVRALEVKERELPPLDDALAARLELKDLADLRATVTDRLRAARREDRREQRRRALLDQLRERHPLALPQKVVDHEVERLVHEYADSLARRGVRVGEAGIDWQQTAEEMRPIAERRVHSRLLLDAIASARGIAVEDDEFERALAALARAQGTTAPALRRTFEEQGRLHSLRDQLRRDKTTRQLLGAPGGKEEDEEDGPSTPAPAGLVETS